MKNDELYYLDLHETTGAGNGTTITRVPGGWIYMLGPNSSPVFIPFNDEFETK